MRFELLTYAAFCLGIFIVSTIVDQTAQNVPTTACKNFCAVCLTMELLRAPKLFKHWFHTSSFLSSCAEWQLV